MLKYLVLAFAFTACGSNEKTTDTTIRQETDVIDVRISAAAPTAHFTSEANVAIGFDDAGMESRLLIHFPKLSNLWDGKVITSSIAVAEILIYCSDVYVNPDNIELHALTTPWSPYASWNMASGFLGKHPWTLPGGDFDETAVHPAIRIDATTKQLAFDVSGMLKDMILGGKPNRGFVVLVKKSADNAKDYMGFKTYNSEQHPSAILAFSSAGDVGP